MIPGGRNLTDSSIILTAWYGVFGDSANDEWSEEYEPEPEPEPEEYAGSLSVMVVNVGIQGS